MREETRVRRAVWKIALVSNAAFFLVLAAILMGTRLAAENRIRRVETALCAGDADTAARLIARMDDGEPRRAYETRLDYLTAALAMEAGDYEQAAQLFTALGSYEDAPQRRKEAVFRQGERLLEAGDYDGAAELLEEIPGYPGAAELRDRAVYLKADALAAEDRFGESFLLFCALGDYADAGERALATPRWRPPRG